MAEPKLLKDTEMLDIIKRAVVDSEIDDSSQYKSFLADLGALICDHFGGEPGEIDHDKNDGLGWCMQFHHNECVPDGGGVFAKYHTDVSWDSVEHDEDDEDDRVPPQYVDGYVEDYKTYQIVGDKFPFTEKRFSTLGKTFSKESAISEINAAIALAKETGKDYGELEVEKQELLALPQSFMVNLPF
ncbi:MAG: hypothetical protein WCT07_03110 [Candidatus Paceibacterota bacterium]